MTSWTGRIEGMPSRLPNAQVGYSIYLGDQFISFEAFPTVMKYYDRLRERPAFQASVPKKEE